MDRKGPATTYFINLMSRLGGTETWGAHCTRILVRPGPAERMVENMEIEKDEKGSREYISCISCPDRTGQETGP